MPLSPPAERQLIHQRRVSCDGFERSDGLWDIEGHMTDIKTYDMENRDRGGIIPTGEPLHGMSIRLTVDLDLQVHAVEAVIDYAPFNYCPQIVDQFTQLEGHRIAPGWTQLTRRLFGGTQGCTHLQELLGPMATTAFQATHLARRNRSQQDSDGAKAVVLNTCHALAQDSPVVRDFWPEHYAPRVTEGDER